jgi:hypothetical protein
MSVTGDCNHKSCDKYRVCRWPYLIAWRASNHERNTAYFRAYNAGRRLAKRQARKATRAKKEAE